jgi:hypothetical protein
MKRLLFLFTLFVALPGFSQQLPGVDFFLRMLGKDTAIAFDSLRKIGFREKEVNTESWCCGDVSYEAPNDFYCATFETDSSTLSMCIHRDRGIAHASLRFGKPQPVYFRNAERAVLAVKFTPKKSGVSGYKQFEKGTVFCMFVTVVRNDCYISFSDKAVYLDNP